MAAKGKGNSKQKPKEREKTCRCYWSKDGQVFFIGGYGWGLHLVEIPSTDGRRSYDPKNICLGKEEVVLAILGGEPIPDTLTAIQQEVLTKIVVSREKNVRSNRYDDRTERFSFGKRACRSFRGHHRYRV